MKKSLPVLSCTDPPCGACCAEQAALPIHLANPNETCRLPGVNPLPEILRLELLALAEKYMRDGFPPDGSPCIWFDEKSRLCKHYEFRPELCRDEVLPGDESCQLWRRKVFYA